MAPPTHPRPYVGVGVLILRHALTSTSTGTSNTSFEFLIGKRLGSHGSNTWALPGGHLEQNESFVDCASRETLEETGLTVTNARYLTTTNDVMPDEGKHYVTVFVVCERDNNDVEPVVMEKDKCAEWRWVGWDEVKRSALKSAGGDVKGREKRDGDEEGEGNGEDMKLFIPLNNLVLQRERDVLTALTSF